MILPFLKGKRLSYWNTNQWAKDLSNRPASHWSGPSEFLQPERKERLSQNAMRRLSAEALYGGYLEDRSFLWAGSYMEPSKFLHLGLDIVVPALSTVNIDQHAILIQIYRDPPGDTEGWGTRLLFKLRDYADIHLVYGHMEPDTLGESDIGRDFVPGEFIGMIGRPEVNGGWSAHLHVQAIYGGILGFLEQPSLLDGYGELSELELMALRYPDPMRFIRLN